MSGERATLTTVLSLVLIAGMPFAITAQPTQSAPDLALPNDAKELSSFSPLATGVWKPNGEGPFPAVILVHGCAGLKQQLVYWRKEAAGRGYVTLIIDIFTSRGSSTCRPRPPVSLARGVKAVLQAADHLKTLPFVDKSRVAMIGMSWGGIVGLSVASPAYVANAAVPGARLDAVVGL